MVSYESLEETYKKVMLLNVLFQTATDELEPIQMDVEKAKMLLTVVGTIREINAETEELPYAEFYRDFAEFARSLSKSMLDSTLKGQYFVTPDEVKAIHTAFSIIENRIITERIKRGLI